MMTTPPGLRQLLLPSLLLFVSPIVSLASADAITGRVVDQNGVGVAGVDIDVINLGSGGNPHEQNDGTDVNGNFLTTIDRAGVYEIRFFAPPPPTTTLLTGVLSPVAVSGTKNLGTITLVNGVSLGGTVKNASNVPVGNVSVRAIKQSTGAVLLLKNNNTSAFGTFLIAVPATSLRLELLTSAVAGQVLAPRLIFTTLTGSTNLGTLTLQPGFHITGTAHNQAGAAVANANLDVIEVATNDTLFTPGDNTSSTGLFDVVIPAGTFDFELNRPPTLKLVGASVNGFTVSAATNLGIMTLRNGVFLTGTIRDRAGAVVQAADVNVHEVATGLPVPLGNDNTNAAGFYSVVVPTGILNVVFRPPGTTKDIFKDRHDGVSVTADTVLDGHLPGPPPHVASPPGKPHVPLVAVPSGRGTPGSTRSIPFISGSVDATGTKVQLIGGLPGAQAQLWFGFEERAIRRLPGLHLVEPRASLRVTLDSLGNARIALPESAIQQGRPFYVQAVVLDPGSEHGFSLSQLLGFWSDG